MIMALPVLLLVLHKRLLSSGTVLAVLPLLLEAMTEQSVICGSKQPASKAMAFQLSTFTFLQSLVGNKQQASNLRTTLPFLQSLF